MFWKLLKGLGRYGDDAMRVIGRYGDDAARIVGRYGDDATRIIGRYGDDAARIIRPGRSLNETIIRRNAGMRIPVNIGDVGVRGREFDTLMALRNRIPVDIGNVAARGREFDKLINTKNIASSAIKGGEEVAKRFPKLLKAGKIGGLLGLGALGGLTAYNYLSGTPSVAGPGEGRKALTDEELFGNELSALDKYLAGGGGWVEPTPVNLVSQYDANAAQAQANLNAYLNEMTRYGGAQSQAIGQQYADMSKQLLKSAQDEFTRGQMTAEDIDALYGALASEQALEATGANVSTPMSSTAGLVAAGGEAATAPEEARVYGRSLADYLGREAGIESAAIERTAQSQALQGRALAQSLLDYINTSAGQQRFNLNNEILAGRTAAQQAQADRNLQLEMSRNQYNASLKEMELQRAMELESLGRSAIGSATQLWDMAFKKNGPYKEFKKELERLFITKENLIKYAKENPEAFYAMYPELMGQA